MAFCSFAGEAGIFASTAVENLFLQEYMPAAPGDYVKVYLYGLMQCCYPSLAEPSLDKFAHTLGMSVEQARKAFHYWTQKGLLKGDEQGNFQYLNVRSVLFGSRSATAGARLYDHAEMANRLAEVTHGRAFTPTEYEMLYDLVDSDHFEENAVILLVEDVYKRFGGKLDKGRLKSMVQEWQQKNLKSEAKARQELVGRHLRDSPANALLSQLGILNRNVTLDEHLLYEKWTEEWNFALPAIGEAISGMTSVRNPNFKYLDKLLESLHNRGEQTAVAIRDAKQEREALDKKIRPVMNLLGIVGSVSEAHRDFYRSWLQQYGLNEEAIYIIAADEGTRSGASFKSLDAAMQSYVRRGLHHPAAILEARNRQSEAAAILREAGVRTEPSATETQKIMGYLQSLSREVVMLAAAYARDSKKPVSYLMTVLEDWQKRGISTLAAARAQLQKPATSYRPAARENSALHHTGERQMEQGGLSHLMDTLDG